MKTGAELALDLKRKLNRLDTASNRSLRQETALRFLTDAYIELVRAKYKASKVQGDDSAFQYTQLTTDELNHITGVHDSAPITAVEGGYTVEISDIPQYWIHLQSTVRTSSGLVSKTVTNPKIVSLDELGNALKDPFNLPTLEEPIIIYEAGKIKFPTLGNFAVDHYRIVYLKKPTTFEWDTEYDIPFDDQVTDIAAVLILEGWESARVQTKTMVNKLVDNS